MKNILNIIKRRVLILDGATGTELQRRGMPQGFSPEEWALKNPELVCAVHDDYRNAGADVIYACTFGANRLKLKSQGTKNVEEANKDLVLLAKRSAKGKAWVAGDIGPTGKFVEPFGSLKFEEAVNIFKEQVRGLLAGGVDVFAIETMMDIQEARAALIAVKELTDKFTMVTMTYEKDGRTLNGTDPLSALVTLQSLGAGAVGCNCSLGPQAILDIIKRIKPYATVPLVAKPNAGMPKLINGQTVFDMDSKEFASFAKRLALGGANIIGGCCGTTPKHIAGLKAKAYGCKPVLPIKSVSALSSARRTIIFDKCRPLVVVGERINPTGKKYLAEELRQGKTSFVRSLAKEQEKNGAHLLDVNVGTSGIDEKKVLKKTISLLASATNLPLVIDSSKEEAIEECLRIYPGRALINSISAEKEKLKRLLPIAAKYGAMFILLPLGKKMPKNFKERQRLIKEVFYKAKFFGFSKNDIVIDGMVMAVSANPKAGIDSLKTIEWSSKSLGCNTIIGLSNISFGLPKRPVVNATYLAMAKAKGLSMAIVNPQSIKVKPSRMARDLLRGRDRDAVKFFASLNRVSSKAKNISISLSAEEKVSTAIIDGNREDIKGFVKEAVNSGISPHNLVHKIMIPAINKVGDLFDKKKYFLPQLIASAESMKVAFTYLDPQLRKNQIGRHKKTVILLATVKGDIHDIGKNIVALMLKNHDFSVVDLGKDVSAARIIREIKKHKFPIVGLSALMTTTMVNMKEVVEAAKQKGIKCKFIVGGAVVNKSYARSLGAEYANNSVEAVRVVKKLCVKD